MNDTANATLALGALPVMAHAREEVLIHQQRLEPAAPPGQKLGEPPRGEVVGERLRPGRENADRLAFDGQAGRRIAAVEPHPPELAHVAEPQLATVVERQHHVNVAILGRARLHDEKLPRHLEVDGQDRELPGGGFRGRRVGRRWGTPRAGAWYLCRPEPDEQLLAAPAHPFDLAPVDCGRESRLLVAPQGRRPVRAGIDDSGARHQTAQVAGDRLDFRQFGHA